MTDLDPVAASSLGYALAIGLLIGLERGWTSRHERAGTRVAGFRTFGLLGLAGGIAGLLPPIAAAVLLGGAGLIILLGYLRQSREPGELSATSAIAGIVVLALAMLATSGRPAIALGAAAAATLLLSMRGQLHGIVRGLSAAELRAAARFAILALVLLPLMPDRAMGPYDALNPHKLMLVIIFVTGLSFAGYILARRASASRSMVLMAACGALVSSTAVTLAFARRLTASPSAGAALSAGIALASAISVARVCVLVAVLAPRAIGPVTVILGPAVVLLAGATWWLLRHETERKEQTVALGNPLELGAALALALFVAISSIASRRALILFGDTGVAGVLAVIGLADVDAAVIAFAAMPSEAMAPHMAGVALAMPVLLNTLLKAILIVGASRSRAHLAAAAPLASAVATITLGIAFALR
jgi:uncharacterized membrane protein (DUF4010 family)